MISYNNVDYILIEPMNLLHPNRLGLFPKGQVEMYFVIDQNKLYLQSLNGYLDPPRGLLKLKYQIFEYPPFGG